MSKATAFYNKLDEKHEIEDDGDTKLINVEEILKMWKFFNLAISKYKITDSWYTAIQYKEALCNIQEKSAEDFKQILMGYM